MTISSCICPAVNKSALLLLILSAFKCYTITALSFQIFSLLSCYKGELLYHYNRKQLSTPTRSVFRDRHTHRILFFLSRAYARNKVQNLHHRAVHRNGLSPHCKRHLQKLFGHRLPAPNIQHDVLRISALHPARPGKAMVLEATDAHRAVAGGREGGITHGGQAMLLHFLPAARYRFRLFTSGRRRAWDN